jgi:ADP-heptose:LPS heptosyltransferase
MTAFVHPARRVLVYRLGSLGDTVVALPALRLVARAFPDAERVLLTNFNVSSQAAPMMDVLQSTGLLHGCIRYPIGMRDVRALWALRRQIRELRPQALVYLAEPRGCIKAWRDALFFTACGIPRLYGVPFSARLQASLPCDDSAFEYEGARLLRCIQKLGRLDLNAPGAFDLALTRAEHIAAQRALDALAADRRLVAISIGAKDDVKDWGDRNWSALLARLRERLPGWGLVMLGADVERDRSQALLEQWRGGGLNLCGRLSVRESAAVLSRARVFCGHDSGPLHLAAAVGTPCVAVFSSRNLPGVWFPYGSQHEVIYHRIDCEGCQLKVCPDRNKECIRSISVDEVLAAVMRVIERSRTGRGREEIAGRVKADTGIRTPQRVFENEKS